MAGICRPIAYNRKMDAAIPKPARNVVCAEAACELDSPNCSGFEPEEINKYLHSVHITTDVADATHTY